MKEHYENIQTILKSVAQTGCYFLSLCDVAEDFLADNDLDAKHSFFATLQTALKNEWLLADMTVMCPIDILAYITGFTWEMTKFSGLFPYEQQKKNEYSIICYKWNNMTHFRRRGYDVYKNSVTVRQGFVLKTYIYKAVV